MLNTAPFHPVLPILRRNTRKLLLVLMVGLGSAMSASAQTDNLTASAFAKKVALSDFCAQSQPDRADAFKLMRVEFDYNHAMAILNLRTDEDLVTLIDQHRALIDAADTVFDADHCQSLSTISIDQPQ